MKQRYSKMHAHTATASIVDLDARHCVKHLAFSPTTEPRKSSPQEPAKPACKQEMRAYTHARPNVAVTLYACALLRRNGLANYVRTYVKLKLRNVAFFLDGRRITR